MSYAELHCLSNFSFQRGASHPHELVERAAELGYSAIAITDECSLAGVVRAHIAAKPLGIKLIIGSEFFLHEDIHLVLLAPDRRAYSELSALISRARMHSAKGSYTISLKDCQRGLGHCLCIWLADPYNKHRHDQAAQLQTLFGERLWLGIHRLHRQDEEPRYRQLFELARHHKLPLLACGNAHMHCRERKPLQDVLTAIRHRTSVQKLGTQLLVNSEHYLRPIAQLQRLYPAALLAETERIAGRCHFSLDELKYEYPDEVVPRGQSAGDFLRQLTEQGARQRWPDGVPDTVTQLINTELALIAELRYEQYFLTVYDIVQYARSQGILCQGRGSAANSAVCYCLHITEVDPSRGQLLMERFISRERDEPPDIDVDFEHERREEVIQYIYRKYGRERAALAATVISYRPRSAIRDVGKALGLDLELINRISKSLAWWDKSEELEQQLQQFNIHNPELFMSLIRQLLGFPRHLSQHVGGFVIAREALANLVPVENAAMAERTIIQWDKEDLEALGLMKVDVLALGMLSAIRKSLDYIGEYCCHPFAMQDIPPEDEATYAMLRQADSVGLFQVESRAQMTMLPRLQPRCFYDLVIQIAIIRPGPIQGGMVHPYLRRRQGLEAVTYASEALESVLERTLGIPIFQEQVIQLAMVAAGFSGGEADQLRRAMARWGRNGQLELFRERLIEGMLERGYSQEFAERLFSQMRGFGAYGFPESHSASFALLAYASAWIKCHHPAAFFCGLLNSQPMGFYSPSQLIQDAHRHDVEIRPICVQHSLWDNSLETTATMQRPALRLGLRQVKGFNRAAAQRLIDARERQAFSSMESVLRRVKLNSAERDSLIRADAFQGFGLHRYQSQWQASAFEQQQALAPAAELSDGVQLSAPTLIEDVAADYQHTRLSLRPHPMALLREQPRFRNCLRAAQLHEMEDGQLIELAGLVTCRQRPGTASGVLFMTLEDETGSSNIVVWADLQQRYRQAILGGRLLWLRGRLQKVETSSNDKHASETTPPVIHVVALQIEDAGQQLDLAVDSHDFR